jgi:NitT/TauT family transport system permease protein
MLVLVIAAVPLVYGTWRLGLILLEVSPQEWATLVVAALATLGRVVLAVALGTLWALPVGLAIGLSPRLSGFFQPVVQVVTAFPASLLYPMVVAGLAAAGVALGWGSIVLMALAAQGSILFNVIAGASAIPSDLKEAVESYRLRGWQRFTSFHVPAVLPYLVTGVETGAGGAWGASIVAEYVTYQGDIVQTWGLGASISAATQRADFPVLAAGLVLFTLILYVLDRTLWRACYRLAEERFTLNK